MRMRLYVHKSSFCSPRCSKSYSSRPMRLCEEHLPGVLDELLDLDEESDGLPAVEDAVVVSEGEVHHGADFDLAVDGDGLVLDGVQTEHGSLGQVDDRGAHEGAENAAVGDGEGAAGHVLDGELVVASL